VNKFAHYEDAPAFDDYAYQVIRLVHMIKLNRDHARCDHKTATPRETHALELAA
jgi:hypothetical protein